MCSLPELDSEPSGLLVCLMISMKGQAGMVAAAVDLACAL
jgi:hypothetical protein